MNTSCRTRGVATLSAFLLVLSGAALSLAATTAVYLGNVEHKARRDAQCARFGALAGLVLGPRANANPALVSSDLASLGVVAGLDGAGNCIVTATSACGRATRSIRAARANALHCLP